jgi:hypothetical protein
MNSFAFCPISVLFFIFSLNKSPVEICRTFLIGATRDAAVPFPEPGGPKNIFLRI